MKRALVFALAVAAGCGGGVGSHDDAADRAVEAMREVGDILEKVTDAKSAEAAKPKLESVAKRLDALVKSVEKLGPPGEDAAGKIDEKMRQGVEALSPRTLAYIERVIDAPEIGKTLQGPFASVQNSFLRLRGMLGG